MGHGDGRPLLLACPARSCSLLLMRPLHGRQPELVTSSRRLCLMARPRGSGTRVRRFGPLGDRPHDGHPLRRRSGGDPDRRRRVGGEAAGPVARGMTCGKIGKTVGGWTPPTTGTLPSRPAPSVRPLPVGPRRDGPRRTDGSPPAGRRPCRDRADDRRATPGGRLRVGGADRALGTGRKAHDCAHETQDQAAAGADGLITWRPVRVG
jgi:hypothetical protein